MSGPTGRSRLSPEGPTALPTRRTALATAARAGAVLAAAPLVPAAWRAARGQETPPAGPFTLLPDGSTSSRWRIGVDVKSTDAMRSLVVSFPVPMDWPDQAVAEIGREVQPEGVKIRETVVGGGVKLCVVTAPVVAAGASCRVVVTFDCIHPVQTLPPDPDRLVRPAAGRFREYLGKSPGIETDHRAVRAAAAEAISPEEAKTRPAWQVARTIYDWVRATVKYEFDPTLRGAAAAVERKVGDCEEMTSLFVAACRLHGIPSRSVLIPGHTYPEFCLADEAGATRWYACQAAGGESFGTVTDARPILQKGDSFVVPGSGPRPVRYVYGSLQARDIGTGSPTLAMIAEPVEESESGGDQADPKAEARPPAPYAASASP